MKDLQANELRIGNFVQGPLGEVAQITQLGHKDNPNYIEAKNEFFQGQNGFSPIPLTEEWLLRFDWNGYKQFCINSYFLIDTKGCLWYCGDFTGIVVEYVHQLQNLYFSLTGKELTLKEQ